ncbi:MAG: sensor histidine kinase, partial [Brachybacterium paraconglomeratum]|nr:sensor histidine kinase [Brachybacterium paraconglomeratum]
MTGPSPSVPSPEPAPAHRATAARPGGRSGARGGLRDPFRWIIENPGTVDLIGFGTAAALMLLFGVGAGGAGWWMLFSIPMVLAGAVCRIRPLLGVIVIGVLAVSHVLVGIPVVAGDAMTFYAMFCAVAYGTTTVHLVGVAAGMLGVFVQATWFGVVTAF